MIASMVISTLPALQVTVRLYFLSWFSFYFVCLLVKYIYVIFVTTISIYIELTTFKLESKIEYLCDGWKTRNHVLHNRLKEQIHDNVRTLAPGKHTSIAEWDNWLQNKCRCHCNTPGYKKKHRHTWYILQAWGYFFFFGQTVWRNNNIMFEN